MVVYTLQKGGINIKLVFTDGYILVVYTLQKGGINI